MSDTIIGVIIGGLIASVNPLLQMYYNHRQSRRQERITYLQEKKTSLIERTNHFMKLLNEAVYDNSITTEFSGLIKYHLPKKIYNMFIEYLDNKNKISKEKIIFDIYDVLSLELVEIEKSIDAMYED